MRNRLNVLEARLNPTLATPVSPDATLSRLRETYLCGTSGSLGKELGASILALENSSQEDSKLMGLLLAYQAVEILEGSAPKRCSAKKRLDQAGALLGQASVLLGRPDAHDCSPEAEVAMLAGHHSLVSGVPANANKYFLLALELFEGPGQELSDLKKAQRLKCRILCSKTDIALGRPGFAALTLLDIKPEELLSPRAAPELRSELLLVQLEVALRSEDVVRFRESQHKLTQQEFELTSQQSAKARLLRAEGYLKFSRERSLEPAADSFLRSLELRLRELEQRMDPQRMPEATLIGESRALRASLLTNSAETNTLLRETAEFLRSHVSPYHYLLTRLSAPPAQTSPPSGALAQDDEN